MALLYTASGPRSVDDGQIRHVLHGGYLMLMRRRLQSAVHGRLLEQAEGLRREADCRRHLLAALVQVSEPKKIAPASWAGRGSQRPFGARHHLTRTGLLNVLFDPVFNQICDLLVVELYRQRVSVAENPHVRQVDGRRVATQTVDRSGPCLVRCWI
jgi:hypothetical protein